MRRIAWIFSIISAVLLVYGLVDFLTNYNWAQGDQDPFFGNPNILLNDGATVLVAAGFLTIGSVIMWVVALRQGKEHGDQQQQ
jgi:uncharacterized membrane protein YedE/YeeE